MTTGVLFSGGVDSLVHLRWAQEHLENVQPYYFVAGQAYAQREVEAAAELAAACGTTLQVLTPFRLHEDPATAQIEFRNAFFLMWLAQLRAPRLNGAVFGMLMGEAPADKNPEFVRRLQVTIDDTRGGNIYGGADPFTIHTPFQHHTKSEMVAWYVRRHGPDYLHLSVGCFKPELPMCGECWSCFNRWLAWRENSLPNETYRSHPGEWMLRKLRAFKSGGGGSERSGLSPARAWSRRRWLREVWRQVNRHCLETRFRSLASVVLDAS